MLNTSIEYKQAMQENNSCMSKASIVLRDGTTISVDPSQIIQGGVTIDDGTSSTSSFDIGSAIINKLTLQLNNMDDVFSDYDFTDAVITVWIGKQLPDRIEWLKKGVFNAEDPKANTSILSIESLDNMEKFDRDYDGNMTFPTTLQALVQYCCDRCGVLSNAGQFDFYDYQIAENPFDPDQDYTYREILHYAAQVAGCYARCNVDGRLEFKWYDRTIFETNQIDGGSFDDGTPAYMSGDNLDGGNFTDYASGDNADGGDFANASWNQYHHITAISSLEVSTDDVVITGIQVKAMDQKQGNETIEGETVLFGGRGYILSISKNPLIPYGNAGAVANHLGQKIVGMRFRKMSASCLGDPAMEAGDAAFVSDRKGNTYQCYITNLTYNTGSFERISTDAETPSRNSSRRYSEITKAIIEAKKDTDVKLSKYDEYVTMMNQLAMNAMGYYQTVVGQDDGSRITYMHDKPNLSDSQLIYKISIDGFFTSKDGGKTYAYGVDKDGNAVMNILSAIGVNADWISSGEFIARDRNGNEMFYVSADTGIVRINAETISITGKSIAKEEQITPNALTETISKGLSNAERIRTAKYLMNASGMSIYDGSFTIYNNAGKRVFGADANGNLIFTGDINNYDSESGKLRVKLTDTTIQFYDETGAFISNMGATYIANNPEYKGIRFYTANEGKYFAWSFQNDETPGTSKIGMIYAKEDLGETGWAKGLHVEDSLYTANGRVVSCSASDFIAFSTPGYGNISCNGNINLRSDASIFLATKTSNQSIIRANDSDVAFYRLAQFNRGANFSGTTVFNGQAQFANVTGKNGYELWLISNLKVGCKLVDNSGWIPVKASGFENASTLDLKENIEPIESALSIIRDCNFYTYEFKSNAARSAETRSAGLIIDRTYSDIPDILLNDEKDAVDIYSLASVTAAAVKELQEELKVLRNEINELKKK